MTSCDDCINLVHGVCVLEGSLTDEDRTSATQGRCPYFKEGRS